MAIISNLLRIIAKPIFLKLGKGLKSSKTQYCLGDELDIRLDESVIGKDNVIAKPPTQTNSLVRWKDGDAKQITDSKTIQDDDGNTTTRTSINGTVSHIIANDKGSTVHSLEATNDRPINRLLIPEKQLVDTYISDKDYSYNVFLNDIENKGLAAHCFRINREGNNFQPFQWSAFAVLQEDTGQIKSNTNYFLGQGTPLNIIVNQGGLLYPGAGNDPSRPATFTCKEGAKYLAYSSVSIKFANNEKSGEIQAGIRVISGNTQRTTSGISAYPIGISRNSATALGGVDAKDGDIIRFLAYCNSPGTTWKIERTLGATYTTYIGVYCLG